MPTVTGRYGINKAKIVCHCKGGKCTCNVYIDGKRKEKLKISKERLKTCGLEGSKSAECVLEIGDRTPLGPKMY